MVRLSGANTDRKKHITIICMRIIRAEIQDPATTKLSASDPEGLHFDFRNNVTYNWEGSCFGVQ